MKRVFGYARASTEEQEMTLKVQSGQILAEYERRYKEKGYEYCGCYQDQGVSGKIPLRQRPEGLKLCAELEKGDLLIVTKLDRGFRSALNFFEELKLFTDKGVGLRMLDLDIDTSTPIGAMLAGISAVVAEFERARTRERTLEVNEQRRRQGLSCGQAPWGWRNARRGKKSEMVKDEFLRQWAGKFLDWHEQGWSAETIFIHCLEIRLKRPNGTEFGAGAIKTAIKNERILRALEAAGVDYPVTIARLNIHENGEQP